MQKHGANINKICNFAHRNNKKVVEKVFFLISCH